MRKLILFPRLAGCVLLPSILCLGGVCNAAEILQNTATWAFSDFLNYRNATSKGWNFGNTTTNAPTVTLLGVTMKGNLGAADATTGLSWTTAPLTYPIGGFAWGGASEQASRDGMSKGGLHGGAGFFAAKLAATAGKTYVVDILALDASAPAGGRSIDVSVDGVLTVNDWHIPVGSPYNKVLRIRTVADADGIDLTFGRGGTAGADGNPAINAIALTEELASPPGFSTQPCSTSASVGGTATFNATASGSPTPTLQWRKDATPLAGQTGATLTLTNVSAADLGSYDVVATNSEGAMTSNPASLALQPVAVATPLTQNLVGYWRFDEVAGCTAADTSGMHNSAGLVNFPRTSSDHWMPGVVGNSLRFGGPDSFQHAIVPNVPKPTTPNYTLSAWVYAESAPVWASIAKNWFGFMHFGLNAGGGNLSNYFGLTSGQPSAVETAVLPLTAWQHVVTSVDASSVKIYRNGNLVATTAYTGTMFSPLPTPMGIGVKLNGAVADTGSPGYWHGRLDEMGLWTRTLSPAEISELYLGGLNGQAIDSIVLTPPRNALVISEFLADNVGGILDEDYDSSDWIELYNGTAAAINLNGYQLQDGSNSWTFPAVTVNPGSYLLVWASGKDRRATALPLHTNFQLSNNGEPLRLLNPTGTIIHAYESPFAYSPEQYHPSPANVSIGIQGENDGHFANPTPGLANVGRTAPGPVIDGISVGAVTEPNQAITVTARIRPIQPTPSTITAPNTILSATLHYRAMWGGTFGIPMFDDGLHGDGAAGDQQFGAVIPDSHGAAAGQMLRYYVTCTSQDASSRYPKNLGIDSPAYEGLIIPDPSITTVLPVLHRFVESPTLADTIGGTTCSISYNGQFIDNCRIRIRGNTSRSWPKKSHKIDLPAGESLEWDTDEPGVTELNLNTTYTDKSYVRAPLVMQLHEISGLPSPTIFHVHQRQNGQFYSVAHWTENVDDTFLKRKGFDERGALYKAVGDNGACDFTTAAAFEKKNRHPEGLTDIQEIVTAMSLTGTALETWLFDNIDLPSFTNWWAGVIATQNIDASNKNFYLYRDTLGCREWEVIPWDVDLSMGPNALNTDTIVYNQNSPTTPICTSHPYLGARPWQLHTNKYNRLLEALANTPRYRAMHTRRIRSLMDTLYLQLAPGADSMASMLATDVTADQAKWGTSSHFNWSGGTAYTLTQSINRLKNEYLTPRASYLLTTHGGSYSLNFSTGLGSAGIPASQGATSIAFGMVEHDPASGNQDQEYIELVNTGADSVDLSKWSISGGITFSFKGGTILPAGESLFISPNRAAFRQRTVAPRGGERRFVIGDYAGHLSNRGETIVLKNAAAATIDTRIIPPTPSDLQQFLVVSEINYNPPGAADDTEYLELLNTSGSLTLDLAGVKITSGLTGVTPTGTPVYFTFASGVSLAPGQRILIVRNMVAFQAAYPAVPTGQIAGAFPADTALDNGGEVLKLEESDGNTILEFRYNDNDPWPTQADGNGYSIVLMRPKAGDAYHGDGANWRLSATAGGNPGMGDAVPLPLDPNGDTDLDGIENLVEFALGESPMPEVEYQMGNDTMGTVTSYTFSRTPGADIRISIEQSADLQRWAPVSITMSDSIGIDGRHHLSVSVYDNPGTVRKFSRARISLP